MSLLGHVTQAVRVVHDHDARRRRLGQDGLAEGAAAGGVRGDSKEGDAGGALEVFGAILKTGLERGEKGGRARWQRARRAHTLRAARRRRTFTRCAPGPRSPLWAAADDLSCEAAASAHLPRRAGLGRGGGRGRAEAAPYHSLSTGGGTRRVRLVREEGRGVSSQYGREKGGRLSCSTSPPDASARRRQCSRESVLSAFFEHASASSWISHCARAAPPRASARGGAAGSRRPHRQVAERAVQPPPPSLPYKVDTSRPSLRTNWTRSWEGCAAAVGRGEVRARGTSRKSLTRTSQENRPSWGGSRG